MVLLATLSAMIAISSSALALPASSQATVFRQLANVPAGWTRAASANLDKPNHGMQLKVFLKQPRLAEFQDLALRIATPGDELYGKHLEQHEIDTMLAPDGAVVKQIVAWLTRAGLTGAKVSERGDAVVVMSSVSDAEQLLQAKYEHFVHEETGQTALGTLQYSLPESLQQYVELVSPSTFLGFPKKPAKTSATGKSNAVRSDVSTAGCSDKAITPACLTSLYNYGGAKAYSNGLIGTGGFEEHYPATGDLAVFLQRYGTQNNQNESYTCEPINGGLCPGRVDSGEAESDLDTQYVRVITQKIPNVYYSTGGRPPIIGSDYNFNEPYLEFLNYFLGLPKDKLPQTLSISYSDLEPTVPVDYQKKTCDLFSQLGAKGVSILVASGDDGAGNYCPKGKYISQYPSGCPWVTAVGGTEGTTPEVAWDYSGGGFSNVFPRPSWQKDAVTKYLKSNAVHNDHFNRSGRAYPDVAAQAVNLQVIRSVLGAVDSVNGTSASCPIFSGIIQLINSDRLASGKTPLGFLNPWLYSKASSALNDITKGSIKGCNHTGFRAVTGWDPATGLGTPDYEALLKISQSS